MSLEPPYSTIRSTVASALPTNCTIYDGAVPNDDLLPTTGGVVNPYVVFHAGEENTTHDARAKGIVGVAHDPLEYDMIWEAVGPTADISRQIFAKIKTALVGYKPTGSSELHLERTQQFTTQKESTLPKTFHRVGMFTGNCNL